MKIKILITSGLILILGLIFYEFRYITYVQDPANYCTWKDGQVTGTTEVGYESSFTPPQKRIRKINEHSFIAKVSKAGQCWYKNDTRPH